MAFLSLHFPYYTDNYEECKDMVRRECGMGLDTDSGKENFQMTAEIAESDRILNYVKNNRDKISRSMLEPEFLNIIIERFVKDDSAVLPSSRKPPPFSHKQLAYIALLKIHKSATLEQIVILLKFIFPSLARFGNNILDILSRRVLSTLYLINFPSPALELWRISDKNFWRALPRVNISRPRLTSLSTLHIV